MDGFEAGIVELLPRLRRFARALARDLGDADDLVQIAIERALLRRHQWREGSRLDSWMFTIVKNAWTDEMRARTRKHRSTAADIEPAKIADPSEPSMEARFEARAAERALQALPEDQRMAVILVLVEGLSYREAAEILGVPQGTLTSRLGRGRAMLASVLFGDEGGGA